MNFHNQLFGLWVPMIISVLIACIFFRDFLRALVILRPFVILTPIMNLPYFWYQDATGWDHGQGVHLIPTVAISIVYFLSEHKKLVLQTIPPMVGYPVLWCSIVVMDLIGGWLFNHSSKTGLMRGQIKIGADGIEDALFIYPLIFPLILFFLPLVFKYPRHQ